MGVESHAKALAAQASGKFADEIVPVTLEDGTVVSADEGPRAGTTVDRLAKLKPVFKEGGSVTAGTSSQARGARWRERGEMPCSELTRSTAHARSQSRRA
eukprot:5012843-Prymnesium_polylepis.1